MSLSNSSNSSPATATSQRPYNQVPYWQKWQPQDLKTAAVTFPAEMYTSPRVYQLEKEQIFGKTWYYVGHTSQLQGAGSYFTVEIAEQPLVILPTQTSELREFFSVCTHLFQQLIMQHITQAV